MTTIQVRGIIIKETQVGESDKYLTIFTKDRGKLIIRARGAKNAKSKFITAQMFAYCDFVIYKGSGFYSLTQIELLESFYNIRNDYDTLMLAYDVTNTYDKYLPDVIEEDESTDFLLLLIKTMKELSRDIIAHDLVVCVFKLKFLQLCGVAPTIEKDYLQGLDAKIKVTNATAYTINYIIDADIAKVYSFTLDKDTKQSLQDICDLFIPKLDS